MTNSHQRASENGGPSDADLLPGRPLRRLSDDGAALPALEDAVRTNHLPRFADIVNSAGLGEHVEVICRWVCSWHIQRVCFWLCRDVPMEDLGSDELREATVAIA